MNFGKAVKIAVGLLVGYTLIKWLTANPLQAASTANGSAKAVQSGTNGFITFITALSGPALLLLVVIVAAIIIARKK